MGVFTRICTKCPAPAWGGKEGVGFEHEVRGGEGICLSDSHSQPPILQSLGSATLPAPTQGLILELSGWGWGRDGRVSSVSLSPPALLPKSPGVPPWHGEGGQGRLQAPGRGQLPSLRPLTLLSCPVAPENSMRDSLCPHVEFAGTEVMTEGDAPP